MLRKTKLMTALMATGFLAGCAGSSSMPNINDYERQSSTEAYKEALDTPSWSTVPSIQQEVVKIGENKTAKNSIPEEIRNREVEIELQPNATFRDLITGISKELKISGYIQTDELSNKGIYLPYYKGSLGELLDNISYNLEVSFVYRNDMLTINESSSYMVTVPNDKEILTRISSTLETLGATSVSGSAESSVIFYDATSSIQNKVEKFLDRIIRNSASVNLQILVINVNVDSERQEGFDWSGLKATIGELGMPAVNLAGGDIDLADRVKGSFGELTGNSIKGGVSKGDVDIQGVFNILNRYGKTTTNQDINMRTISGKKVTAQSLQKTPYIDDLTQSVTSDSVSSSGIDTETAENGIELSFNPFYDSESGLIAMDVDLSLKTLLGFIELSAGEQGTIEQPRTQEQAFNNSLRMRAGQTVVIGGITYSSVSDNRNRPIFLDKIEKGASKNLDITENSLFIIVRPTVVEYVSKRLGGEK